MSDAAVVTLIQRHLRRYPEGNFSDIYKLLHQAAFGPGHLISDKKKALEWIEKDLEGGGAEVSAPLVEAIHPAGAMVRVHLRPYAAHDGALEPLRDALVRSAVQRPDAPTTLAHWWEVFCEWAAGARDDRLDGDEARLFGMACARQHWPAVHHSRAYREAYRPAYRVLTAAEAESLLTEQHIPYEVI